jgi:hypothetical protein
MLGLAGTTSLNLQNSNVFLVERHKSNLELIRASKAAEILGYQIKEDGKFLW